jgi:hypothetical protein
MHPSLAGWKPAATAVGGTAKMRPVNHQLAGWPLSGFDFERQFMR